MNKKVISLIIVIILVAVIGGIVFAVTQKSKTQNNDELSNNNQNQEVKNNEKETNKVANKETNENSNTNTSKQGKALVLYFSQSGNTETVANFIHDEVGGDIIKLETTKAYPSDYNELVNYAQDEQRQNARPELKTKIDNIEEYDTIFLGYPNWWADMPMPLYTFLDEYDLSGKRVAPFITHGGSGLSGTPNKIKQEEPNATVTEGLAISGSAASSSKNTVQNWLSKIGF